MIFSPLNNFKMKYLYLSLIFLLLFSCKPNDSFDYVTNTSILSDINAPDNFDFQTSKTKEIHVSDLEGKGGNITFYGLDKFGSDQLLGTILCSLPHLLH